MDDGVSGVTPWCHAACAKSGSAFVTPDTNSYLYNTRSELTNATAAVDAAYCYGYNFDDIGNRKMSAERGTDSVYTANSLNQYASITNISTFQHSNLPTPQLALANPWRFSSEYAEDDTATVYYNYRHYEPVTGRWMARDGLGEMGGLGLYIFVGNCTSYFDLLGLDGLALNAPTRIESPQEDQPKDNPQRVLELGGSSAIRVVDIYMTLGITDPVVSYELTCVCTSSKYHEVCYEVFINSGASRMLRML